MFQFCMVEGFYFCPRVCRLFFDNCREKQILKIRTCVLGSQCNGQVIFAPSKAGGSHASPSPRLTLLYFKIFPIPMLISCRKLEVNSTRKPSLWYPKALTIPAQNFSLCFLNSSEKYVETGTSCATEKRSFNLQAFHWRLISRYC